MSIWPAEGQEVSYGDFASWGVFAPTRDQLITTARVLTLHKAISLGYSGARIVPNDEQE